MIIKATINCQFKCKVTYANSKPYISKYISSHKYMLLLLFIHIFIQSFHGLIWPPQWVIITKLKGRFNILFQVIKTTILIIGYDN